MEQIQTQLKPKKCRSCLRPFVPRNSLQMCCSPNCAINYARARGEGRQSLAMKRVALAEKREQREALKPLTKLLRETQGEFNRFIRQRDYFDGCISCHMPWDYPGQWHAGHYRTTGAAAHLRFNENNVHKQCAQCNNHKSGNVVEYRKRLVQKIGAAAVELLEDDNRTVKWTRDELVAMRKEYSAKWRALKKEREAR